MAFVVKSLMFRPWLMNAFIWNYFRTRTKRWKRNMNSSLNSIDAAVTQIIFTFIVAYSLYIRSIGSIHLLRHSFDLIIISVIRIEHFDNFYHIDHFDQIANTFDVSFIIDRFYALDSSHVSWDWFSTAIINAGKDFPSNASVFFTYHFILNINVVEV